jgi:ABC-2 type transport system permease protein
MFITNIESEEGITLSPSLTGFASIDISDKDGLIVNQLNNEVLSIENSNNMDDVKSGKSTALLIVPENSTEGLSKFQTVTVDLFINSADPKQIVVSEEVNTAVKAISSSISNQWISSLVPSTSTIEPDVREEKKGESLPLQLIKKMMVSILLFLPLFLFGNMIIDSIVGEKERKTGEILVAMPLSHRDILIGKNFAIVLTIALQVALWLIILLMAGFEIKNPILVYIIVILTSVPIIGVTSAIATYSRNYKEAGIGLSFAYITIVGFLVVPALAYISSKALLSNISPMTLVMRLFSGENITALDFMIPLISIVIVSLISYWISIKLFKRDDIMFGPRPGIIRLALDIVGIKKNYS